MLSQQLRPLVATVHTRGVRFPLSATGGGWWSLSGILDRAIYEQHWRILQPVFLAVWLTVGGLCSVVRVAGAEEVAEEDDDQTVKLCGVCLGATTVLLHGYASLTRWFLAPRRSCWFQGKSAVQMARTPCYRILHSHEISARPPYIQPLR